MKPHRTTRTLTFAAPVRVRHEPPTITEAVEAARDLASDLQQQADIVAGLMGITHHEAREHVASHPARGQTTESRPRQATGPGRVPVVVIKRTPLRSSVQRGLVRVR